MPSRRYGHALIRERLAELGDVPSRRSLLGEREVQLAADPGQLMVGGVGLVGGERPLGQSGRRDEIVRSVEATWRANRAPMQYPTQTFAARSAAGSDAMASKIASVSARTSSGFTLATSAIMRSIGGPW